MNFYIYIFTTTNKTWSKPYTDIVYGGYINGEKIDGSTINGTFDRTIYEKLLKMALTKKIRPHYSMHNMHNAYTSGSYYDYRV